jgi:ABC-type polysaccharide/polyol phosphate transport system ATPase subunit
MLLIDFHSRLPMEIGWRYGAGKTTLLRVLAGIYIPFPCQVRIEGKIAPLFDAGFGMDIDATGYENIFLRSIYLALSRREMESKIDNIVEF